jgi:hypothetical protein
MLFDIIIFSNLFGQGRENNIACYIYNIMCPHLEEIAMEKVGVRILKNNLSRTCH